MKSKESIENRLSTREQLLFAGFLVTGLAIGDVHSAEQYAYGPHPFSRPPVVVTPPKLPEVCPKEAPTKKKTDENKKKPTPRPKDTESNPMDYNWDYRPQPLVARSVIV